MNKQNSAFRPLFGHYFLELQRFLASLIGFKNNENGEPIRPVVLMGTPSAAFRNIITPQSNSNYVSERSFVGITNFKRYKLLFEDKPLVSGLNKSYFFKLVRNINTSKNETSGKAATK